ncbi:unnamed protein product [Penicillium salamii]|nr:unnamed protein product [Penicillium salamii]
MMRSERNPRNHPYEPARPFEESSEEQIATTTEYKRHSIFSHHEWLLEIVSCILALASLVGIAGILLYMNNKPLSEWVTFPSLNASISILTSTCTALFMFSVSEFIGQYKWVYFKKEPRRLADFEKFDKASRGAWGSLKVISTMTPSLVTVGAIITLMRYAFPSFIQQVVSIAPRDISTGLTNSASFGYAHSYNHLDKYSTPSGLANAAVEAYPQDPGMQSAIIQGLYGVTPIEPFKCPGACNWTETHISLGFKAECRNVTQETLKTAICERSEYREKCNMTTPGGIGLASQYAFTEHATAYNMNVTALASKQTIEGQLQDLPEIARFAIYRSTPDYNFLVHDINITDCSLFLAVYAYSDIQTNGSNISFVRREVDLGVENAWQWPTDILSSLHINETTNGDVHIPALEMNYITFMALRNFLMSTTIVTEWLEGSFKNPNLGVSAPLRGDVDLTKRFEGMATAMTNYLRYGTNGLTADGLVIQSVPWVSINWWWFLLPAVTMILIILLTVITLVQNRESRRVPLWKSSALAVLECRLQLYDEKLGSLQSAGRGVDEIEKEAKQIKVYLP